MSVLLPHVFVQRVKQASVREGNQFKEYARQQAQQREDDIRLLKVRHGSLSCAQCKGLPRMRTMHSGLG